MGLEPMHRVCIALPTELPNQVAVGMGEMVYEAVSPASFPGSFRLPGVISTFTVQSEQRMRHKHTYFPVLPSHTLTDLSKEALAISLASGEKSTSLMSC